MRIGPLRVIGKIGEGTFGKVLECSHVEYDTTVAVKMVKAGTDYAEAAIIEAQILSELNRLDPESQSGCVKLYDYFTQGDHVCLVMERLGPNLYDFMMRNRCSNLSMEDIQTIATDLLRCLGFFKKVGLVHTDLKPENVVFRSDRIFLDRRPQHRCWYGEPQPQAPVRPIPANVKIVDFGGATWTEENTDFTSLINTRQYRAPEVILDLGWNTASDLWGLGCLLVELFTGRLLFGTHEHLEHLAMMEKIIGTIPPHMLAGAVQTRAAKYIKFSARNEPQLYWPGGAESSESTWVVNHTPSLEDLLRDAPPEFVELLRLVLVIDPSHRADPVQLLSHPFFSVVFERVTTTSNSAAAERYRRRRRRL